MNRRLFVPDQHLLEWRTLEFIEKREDSATGVVENGLYPFLLQRFNDDLRTGLFHDESQWQMSKPKVQRKSK
jgi:hypothetical protein